MGTIKTKGIVIAENNLGDFDKMLTILTPHWFPDAIIQLITHQLAEHISTARYLISVEVQDKLNSTSPMGRNRMLMEADCFLEILGMPMNQ